MRGRPKTLKGQKIHANFTLYADEKEKLIALAEQAEITMSAYIRKAVLEKMAQDEK